MGSRWGMLGVVSLVFLVSGTARSEVPGVYQGTELQYRFNGAAGDGLGHAVDSAGDVDADGVPDVIVGAPFAPAGTAVGYVHVYSGRTGKVLWRFDGTAAGDAFGRAVSGAGDVDADGHADLIVGAPGADLPNQSNNGAVYVYSGKTGALLWQTAGSAGFECGNAVDTVGDLDGDGADDIAFGISRHTGKGPNTGNVVVVSIHKGRNLYTLEGDAEGEEFGFSLAGVGDVTGDGAPDLLVGSRFALGGVYNVSVGRVQLFSGGALLQGLAQLYCETWRVVGQPYDQLGYAVAAAGDHTGDGLSDVVVGAPYNDSGGADAGSAWVLRGDSGELLFTCDGMAPGERAGGAVSGAGDTNADGVNEVIVGSLFDGSSTAPGRVRLWWSNAAPRDLSEGPFDGMSFGVSVAGLGDLNRDGYAEVAVGDPAWAYAGTDGGSASVYASRSTTCADLLRDLAAWWTLDGTLEELRSGSDFAMIRGTSAFTGMGSEGQALFIDATRSEARAYVAEDFPTAARLTLSAWINPATITGGSRMILGPSWAWKLYTDGGRVCFVARDASRQTAAAICTQRILAPGEWVHVVVTSEYESGSGAIHLYLDGSLEASDSYVSAPTTGATGALLLGEYAQPYVGGIDEVQVWRRTLSQAEISYLAASGRSMQCKPSACESTPSGLTAWWTGDSAPGTANEESPDAATWVGSGSVKPGLVGNALDLSSGYLEAMDASSRFNRSGFTWAAWFDGYSSVPISGNRLLAAKGLPGALVFAARFDWSWSMASATWRWESPLGRSTTTLTATLNSSVRALTHVAATFDGTSGIARLYVNGVLQREQMTAPGASLEDSSGPLLLGSGVTAQNMPPERYFGRLDEVMLFDRALSRDEVSDLFTTLSVGFCKGCDRDQEVPVLVDVPADVTLECAGPAGTPYEFTDPTATDDRPNPVTVVCSPASGSLFPLGDTVVTCTATDACGKTTTATFTVTVVDTTPPVVTCPPDIAVDASASEGAGVSFDVSATDACDGEVPVLCDWASGSTFPIGTTTVTCHASDAAGHLATCSFQVTVRSLQDVQGSVTESLQALLGSEDPAVEAALQGAIDDLTAAQEPSYWVDATHLTPQGAVVYDLHQTALADLSSIPNPGPEVLDAIARILDVDRILAQTAIDEASGGGGARVAALGVSTAGTGSRARKPSSEPRWLRQAREAMEKADREIRRGRYVKGAREYEKAWRLATSR